MNIKWQAYCKTCKEDLCCKDGWANGNMVEAQARLHMQAADDGAPQQTVNFHDVIVGYKVQPA